MINFLILVWILKRFLYQPVLNVIASRRAGIEKTLTDAQRIETAATETGLHIKVQSAFPLDNSKRNELSRLLNEMTGKTLPIEFHINPELISGFQIDIGPWILHANLRDELKFFSGALRHAG